ncbi:MAG TPA: methionyl-tRNA formyltransferase [Myxococcaceae bacterium]|nr:methionyl-tRNA formyltransferase [Myxococcaceae bacterium]
MSSPRIIFMGTPEFAVESLRACLDVGDVVAVVTRPDKPRGRGQLSAASPVKRAATQLGIRVLQPIKLREAGFLDAVRELSPDVAVVAAYGKILPRELLEVPGHGCINVHASLLPRFRGAAPIQWAIASGDNRSGVCLMKMDEGLDTGPILRCAEVPIGPEVTSDELQQTLARVGAELIRRYLPDYLSGKLQLTPQSREGVVLAPMLKKEDGQLDFGRPAAELERRVRAFQPWPGAFTRFQGKVLKVHRARTGARTGSPGTVLAVGEQGIEVACGEGSLSLLQVQPEGKRTMSSAEFLAGHRIAVGEQPFGA